MAYDSVRRQLDALLGADRNRLPSERRPTKVLDYDDPSICKDFLLGLCLSTVAIKGRGVMSSCGKTHAEDAKRRFEEMNEKNLVRDKRRWQRSLAESCRAIVEDEDRRILTAARRLKESYGFSEPPAAIMVKNLGTLQALGMLPRGLGPGNSGDTSSSEGRVERALVGLGSENRMTSECSPSIAVLSAEGKELASGSAEIKILGEARGSSLVETMLKEKAPISEPTHLEKHVGNSGVVASALNDDGKGEGESSTKLPSSVETPKLVFAKPLECTLSGSDLKSTLIASVRPPGIGPDGLLLNKEYKLRVCALCGGLISLHDSDTRLASHYHGKTHSSMVAVREKLEELEAALRSDADGESRYSHARATPRPGSWKASMPHKPTEYENMRADSRRSPSFRTRNARNRDLEGSSHLSPSQPEHFRTTQSQSRDVENAHSRVDEVRGSRRGRSGRNRSRSPDRRSPKRRRGLGY